MASSNDVFVGNLAFNTTEEQLREFFSFVGTFYITLLLFAKICPYHRLLFIAPVKTVRLQLDKDTGKPKGFAFVEFFDTNSALSAIKHLDQADFNSRKIKVGYPNQG